MVAQYDTLVTILGSLLMPLLLYFETLHIVSKKNLYSRAFQFL